MSARFAIRPGDSYPMGATVDANGTNFAIYSSTAKQVELCLFDDSGHSEIARIPLFRDEQGIWHLYIKGLQTGQLYGYRVFGDYKPHKGLRHNPNKLLIDPYAKSLFGEFRWGQSHQNDGDNFHRDSAVDTPKSQVVSAQPYQGQKPNTPWHKTIIYECHVKGVSAQFPEINKKVKGTYLALIEPVFINHLKSLGITAIELLPVQQFISEQFAIERGLVNYWGYNTLNFFTVHDEYALEDPIAELKEVIKVLHQHEIEVIMDVVYNHTAEGNQNGPILSLRGFDNACYYRLNPENPSFYINDTGCGNTLNLSSSKTLALIMDSLRYWVSEFGIDGFRFDLATILGRYYSGFNDQHTFFQTLAQDPTLKGIKLIAEPWDIGLGGYQLGNFMAPWREWNDKYRDTVRRFWRGDEHMLPEFAHFFHGSSTIFEAHDRAVTSSINFITAHDGFTLTDLVSFNDKHNHDNGEGNRDGHSDNHSHNWGFEGHCDDEKINRLRLQQQKNLLLTLFLSTGVPMFTAGSECNNSQQGNNNAYCQDNPLGWVNWPDNFTQSHPLYQFIQSAIAIRNQFSLYRQQHFIHDNDKRFDVAWRNHDAQLMTHDNWHQPENHALGYHVIDRQDEQAIFIAFNASKNDIPFTLPPSPSKQWALLLSSCDAMSELNLSSDATLTLNAHSIWVFSSQLAGA